MLKKKSEESMSNALSSAVMITLTPTIPLRSSSSHLHAPLQYTEYTTQVALSGAEAGI
jgi:hypothetical protein